MSRFAVGDVIYVPSPNALSTRALITFLCIRPVTSRGTWDWVVTTADVEMTVNRKKDTRSEPGSRSLPEIYLVVGCAQNLLALNAPIWIVFSQAATPIPNSFFINARKMTPLAQEYGLSGTALSLLVQAVCHVDKYEEFNRCSFRRSRKESHAKPYRTFLHPWYHVPCLAVWSSSGIATQASLLSSVLKTLSYTPESTLEFSWNP